MSDTPEKPSTDTKKTEDNHKKQDRFEHLAEGVAVKNKPHQTWAMAGVIVVIALVAIFWVMLRHRDKPTHETLSESRYGHQDDLLAQNARRLSALQRHAGETSQKSQQRNQQLWGASPQHAKAHEIQNKEMIARRNAPTQMYNAKPATPTTKTAKSQANTKVFAGHSAAASFANGQSAHPATVTATAIAHPAYTIAQGEFLHATLETAINSDLQGMVRAVVTKPAYGYTGQQSLIPAGSRLIGQYASLASNRAATERVLVIWNRVITPNGLSLMINSPGSDALGQAGVGADAVNHHFVQIFGTATLLSIMSATTSTAGVGDYDQPNSANQYRQSIASAFQQSAQNILSQNLSIRPTLHIDQGRSINVFVARDLDCYPVKGRG